MRNLIENTSFVSRLMNAVDRDKIYKEILNWVRIT